MEMSPLPVTGCKNKDMPNAQAGRDLYCVTPAVTRVLGFSVLIRTTASFNRHVRQAKWCQRAYSDPDPRGGFGI